MKDDLDRQRAKEAAARAALKLIQPGMLLGLGTGSTVLPFLRALGELCREGLQITGVGTSDATEQIAFEEGIPLLEMEEVTFVDMTIDGADEIDLSNQMIKGGGGALLREKIVASSSREMVVIVDDSKCVSRLGKRHPLPVEIVSFGAMATLAKLARLGYNGELRQQPSGERFVTDNGNYILDLDISRANQPPKEIDRNLRAVPGVIETGLFLNLAGRVLVGFADGHVEVRT